jgi:DNA-directed RNA polymerase specialized sigma subunit
MVTDGNRETNMVAMVAVKANSVSIYLTVIVYHMLSNVEKEKLVIDLYYNQGKNVREIAQEDRMSFRDIGTILKKGQVNHGIVITDNGNNNNNKPANEKATQAYKLFTEGKKPVDVAIQLGLSEKEATRYFTEYWRLRYLYKLHSIYKEL